MYKGRLSDGVLLGIAEPAAEGRPSLEVVATPAIIHEWTSRPGVLLYHSIVSTLDRNGLRQRICGQGGLYEQYAAHRITAVDVHVLLATSIVTLSASAATFWAPLAVLVTVTLMRRGLAQ